MTAPRDTTRCEALVDDWLRPGRKRQCGNRAVLPAVTCYHHNPERKARREAERVELYAYFERQRQRERAHRSRRVTMQLTFTEAATLHVFFEAYPDVLSNGGTDTTG